MLLLIYAAIHGLWGTTGRIRRTSQGKLSFSKRLGYFFRRPPRFFLPLTGLRPFAFFAFFFLAFFFFALAGLRRAFFLTVPRPPFLGFFLAFFFGLFLDFFVFFFVFFFFFDFFLGALAPRDIWTRARSPWASIK